MIGVIDDIAQACRQAITAPEESIYVIGNEGLGTGWLSNSVYAHIIAENTDATAPPPVDLTAEKRHADAYARSMIRGRFLPRMMLVMAGFWWLWRKCCWRGIWGRS